MGHIPRLLNTTGPPRRNTDRIINMSGCMGKSPYLPLFPTRLPRIVIPALRTQFIPQFRFAHASSSGARNHLSAEQVGRKCAQLGAAEPQANEQRTIRRSFARPICAGQYAKRGRLAGPRGSIGGGAGQPAARGAHGPPDGGLSSPCVAAGDTPLRIAWVGALRRYADSRARAGIIARSARPADMANMRHSVFSVASDPARRPGSGVPLLAPQANAPSTRPYFYLRLDGENSR